MNNRQTCRRTLCVPRRRRRARARCRADSSRDGAFAAPTKNDPAAEAIAKGWESKLNAEGLDLSTLFTLVQKKPGESDRVLRVQTFRRDSADMFTIIFQYPDSEKGKGYLRRGDDLYFYIPATREFVYRNSKDNIGSTDARTDLFGRQNVLAQYWVTSAGTATVSKWECDVVRLDAKVPDVSYPVQKWYVRKSDGLPVKVENFSVSETAPRDILLYRLQDAGEREVPLHEAARREQSREGAADLHHQRQHRRRGDPRLHLHQGLPGGEVQMTQRRLAIAVLLVAWLIGAGAVFGQDAGAPDAEPAAELVPAGQDPFAEGQDPFDVSAFDQTVEQGTAQEKKAALEVLFGGNLLFDSSVTTTADFDGYAAGGSFSGKGFVKVSVPDYGAAYVAYNFAKNVFQGTGGSASSLRAG